ncbi:MAG: DUF2029 domain-containing protein [Rhodoluna sp.]|nr:DUF2029 domain-containing protein [Rhodoluna sp.]MBP6186540.1 DUF2029 domain-containing protein [Rhodoluna sp.]
MTETLMPQTRKPFESIWLLLIAGLFAHLWLIYTGLRGIGTPMGDILYAYQPWVQFMIDSQKLLGINVDWVYPYPAMIPMWASILINPNDFQAGWLTLITAVDLLLIAMIANFGKSDENTAARFGAAWFWLFFLVALGPVSISRVDAFSVAVAMFGVLALANRKLNASTAWFTIGVSMKIWPAAILVVAMAASKYRARILLAAAATGGIVIAIGLLLGGNLSLFSFLTNQADRGIQIESVIAAPFIWSGIVGLSNNEIYYDNLMMTFQVAGDAVSLVAGLMSIAMAVAIAITAFLAWRAAKAGAGFREILPIAVLTATLDLIVFNKVGSPQFVTWLAVAIILGIFYQAHEWRLPMFAVVAIALLTNLVYPVFYDEVLKGNPAAFALLTLRNLVYVGLLIWSNVKLSSLAKRQ